MSEPCRVFASDKCAGPIELHEWFKGIDDRLLT
jgi:hypothetical protein